MRRCRGGAAIATLSIVTLLAGCGSSSHSGTIALNYGLAIIVYAVLAAIVTGLLARSTFAARRPLPY